MGGQVKRKAKTIRTFTEEEGEPTRKMVRVAWPRAASKDIVGQAWPKVDRAFCAWKDDDQYDLWREVLGGRGWRNAGELVPSKDVTPQMKNLVKGKRQPPPGSRRRCLYISCIESEHTILCNLPHRGKREPKGGQWRLAGFPGTMPACKKWATAAQMAKCKNAARFFPQTYVLPRDRGALRAAATAARTKRRSGGARSYWIAKPRNGYGGQGVVVFNAAAPEFGRFVASERTAADVALRGKRGKHVHGERKQEGTVVQRYIPNPMLIGGYKFHMRVHVLVTQFRPQPMAFVHSDGHVQFATRPFTLAPSTLGRSFEPMVHLTNYDANVKPSNLKAVLANKPGIGCGVIKPFSWFEAYLKRAGPLSWSSFWDQALCICRDVVSGIASHHMIRRYQQVTGRHFQLLGFDLMMDANGKVWFIEVNDTPGVASLEPYLLRKQLGDKTVKNPDTEAGDAVTKRLLHDTVAILGLDGGDAHGGKLGRFWRLFD